MRAARLEKILSSPAPQFLSLKCIEDIPLFEYDGEDVFEMWSVGLGCILIAKKSGHIFVWDMGRNLLIGEGDLGEGTLIQTLKPVFLKNSIQIFCVTRYYFDEGGSVAEDDVDDEG